MLGVLDLLALGAIDAEPAGRGVFLLALGQQTVALGEARVALDPTIRKGHGAGQEGRFVLVGRGGSRQGNPSSEPTHEVCADCS